MIKFAKATLPSKPKNKMYKYAGLVLAGITTAMVVSQLFKFEEFGVLLSEYPVASLFNNSIILAAIIISLEVFSLPFLLRMKISPAFRIVSMFFGWLVAGIWFYLATIVPLVSDMVVEPAMFGGLLTFLPMFAYSLLASLITILTILVSFGMWPKLSGIHK